MSTSPEDPRWPARWTLTFLVVASTLSWAAIATLVF